MKKELISPDNLTRHLKYRYQELNNCLELLQKNSKNAPQGHLRIAQRGGNRPPQFYYINSEDGKHFKYLHKAQLSLIKRLAQKDYDSKLIKLLQSHIKALEKYITSTEGTIEQLYSSLNPTRQSLIIPATLTDSQYIEEWQNVTWKGRPFTEDTPEYITARNERVRSKSEVIIADTLSRMNIPYKYEYPLELKNNNRFYPDFLCLNLRTRQEFLWEHFGMMDLSDYLENAVGKIKIYNENNYFIGKNLIITMETQNNPINIHQIQQLINAYLK